MPRTVNERPSVMPIGALRLERREERRTASDTGTIATAALLLLSGCAAPQYAIRQAPVPEESASALQIERSTSRYQAVEFEQAGARPLGAFEALRGFRVQAVVDRLSRVTERPGLPYHAYLVHDDDPNAAALADGRIYLTTGLIHYLAARGSRAGELAFILGHELAHTVAQHLVKRYRAMQQQEVIMAILAAGAQAVARAPGTGVQRAGQLALDAASVLRSVHNSGFSQEQELEADQLGIQYVIRAGFDPRASLELLQDFERFEHPSLLLRTHPYISLRRQYLERYLIETGRFQPPAASSSATGQPEADHLSATGEPRGGRRDRLRQLRQLQTLYPEGSVSWNNLQRQIDALE